MDYSIFVYLILTALVVALGWFVNLPAGRTGVRLHNGKTQEYCGVTRQQAVNRILITAVFLLLFAVSACRIAVGNDYWVYRDDFLLIEQNRHVSFEFGFIWMVRFLQSMLNHDQYLPIFAVFFLFYGTVFCTGYGGLKRAVLLYGISPDDGRVLFFQPEFGALLSGAVCRPVQYKICAAR